jgi:hypothetical protein
MMGGSWFVPHLWPSDPDPGGPKTRVRIRIQNSVILQTKGRPKKCHVFILKLSQFAWKICIEYATIFLRKKNFLRSRLIQVCKKMFNLFCVLCGKENVRNCSEKNSVRRKKWRFVADPFFATEFRIKIRIRIRIHRIYIFLGHPDPDPLFRGMNPDPDPDPSISKFCYFFWTFIFEKWCKCTFKK